MTEKRQLGDMRSMRIKGDDEENTAFGFPAKAVDQKSGFDGEVAKQEVRRAITAGFAPEREKGCSARVACRSNR